VDRAHLWECIGEAEEEGYEDEYQLEDIEISAVTYIKAVPLPNFRKAWEDTNSASELSDDYGLGVRDSLQVDPASVDIICWVIYPAM
jgi:hypothetical protein